VDENTLWIPISKVPENQRDELRADMVAGRVRYRYLDAQNFEAAVDENQPPRPRKYIERDPGAAFWHCANINWTWSAAVAGSVVISGLEVRIDGESTAAENTEEPHARSKKWKALVRTEFETRLAAGVVRSIRDEAPSLQKWLKKTHNIECRPKTIQNELTPRRSQCPKK
jgi:hypothetical protein